MEILGNDFYLQGHVVDVAKRLLGTLLYTSIEGKICSGKIVEVEAYSGRNDKACHANNGKRTNRTEVMYAAGGVAYVYLCYGIHNMFNIVTNEEHTADAVLVRAVEPLEGIKWMLERKSSKTVTKIASGPGNVCKAFGIERWHNGLRLDGDTIWIAKGKEIAKENIVATTRIGVEYAKEDALLPWRFYVKDNWSVSKK
jgi:DNA-3-methyladenine glycosylase